MRNRSQYKGGRPVHQGSARSSTQPMHLSDQLMHLLDYAEANQHLLYTYLNHEQQIQYNKLKEGMMDATHPEELRFYEHKLSDLIKKMNSPLYEKE